MGATAAGTSAGSGVFFTAPGYDGLPLVLLRLAAVDLDRLTELVTDAWQMRVPDALVNDREGEPLGDRAGEPLGDRAGEPLGDRAGAGK
ncbi:uncharacterized protein ONO86_06352 [Micromonospora noduli]|nr:uncharacterized protein ONO86_06352 [Micromonospora noduli]